MAVLGLDAGGSGSRAVLVADDGEMLAAARGAPARAALPEPDLRAALSVLVRDLAGGPGRRPRGALRVVAGFAGAGRPDAAARARRALEAALGEAGLPAESVHVLTDAHIALLSVAPESEAPAAVLIAGTGSMALAGTGAAVARAGGWGRYLGDEGSGFWLGRRALEVAARAADGRCPEGRALAAAVLEALGLEDIDGAVMAAPDLWAAPDRVAALAPVLLRAAAEGDRVAGALVREAGRALAEILMAARNAAGLPAGAPTGLVGGLWRAGAGLRQALAEALPPEIDRTCQPPAVPPAVGAACHLLGAEARRRLLAAAPSIAWPG